MHYLGIREASYLLVKHWGAVILGMFVVGAWIGDSLGLGMILVSLGGAWGAYLFQDRLVYLPSAPSNVQESVWELSRRLGIAPPAVFVFRSVTANATAISGAFSSVVVVDSKLLDFPQDEIDATLAHELAHIKNQDVLSLMGVMTMIALVGINVAIGAVDKWAVAAAVGLLPLVSWAMEFKADALGARAHGDPAAMVNLLRHFESNKKLVDRFFSSVIVLTLLCGGMFFVLDAKPWQFSELLVLSCLIALALPTHPPTRFRIWRLRRMSLATSAT